MEKPQSQQEQLIANKEAVDAKIQRMQEAGPEKLHVLTDFDRTLTKGTLNGKKTPSIISRLRDANYLSDAYTKEAHRLFNHYHPIEIDESIPLDQRIIEMHDWWMKHFQLLFDHGLTLDVLHQAVKDYPRMFRNGVDTFLDRLAEKGVPTIIMSASLGDMIRLYLQAQGRMHPSISIVSNLFTFNEEGIVTGVKEPIVHSLNKSEVILSELPVYTTLKDRKHVLLLGDGLGDLGMVDGFEADEVLSIGFFNEDHQNKENLHLFTESYDIVLTGDGGFDPVNKLVTKLLSYE